MQMAGRLGGRRAATAEGPRSLGESGDGVRGNCQNIDGVDHIHAPARAAGDEDAFEKRERVKTRDDRFGNGGRTPQRNRGVSLSARLVRAPTVAALPWIRFGIWNWMCS